MCISIWKEDSGPSLQSLNLMATIGYTLAPLLCKPFISSTRDTLESSFEKNSSLTEIKVTLHTSFCHWLLKFDGDSRVKEVFMSVCSSHIGRNEKHRNQRGFGADSPSKSLKVQNQPNFGASQKRHKQNSVRVSDCRYV